MGVRAQRFSPAGFLRRTPVRTFLVYPLLALAFEAVVRGQLEVRPVFLPLLAWGYLQYRLCGSYRLRHGGGGPGLDRPPERLVTTGPYAFCRNPMYLGHLIFLAGLALTLSSYFAALLALASAAWFHRRVLKDEARLAARWGGAYLEYCVRVRRWLPGLF
jgi:protein-S-isoprenylcysteine O-methyltransferase Ste14